MFFDFIKYLTFDFIKILLRLFQSLGIFNKNIHTVSAFHVYLEKLYEIEKNKDDITSENFVVDNSVESNVVVSLENISFKYLGTEEGMFNELSLHYSKKSTHYNYRPKWFWKRAL